jgi:hypothetical protein
MIQMLELPDKQYKIPVRKMEIMDKNIGISTEFWGLLKSNQLGTMANTCSPSYSGI